MADEPNGGNDGRDERHLAGEGHAEHRFNPEKAEAFRDPDRLERLRLDALVEVLELWSGDRVLDLGTGSGALLPRLSEAVCPTGTVLGLDVSSAMLEQAHEHVRRHDLTNVILMHNAPDRLPMFRDGLDAVLIVSSLHEFSHPAEIIGETARVLRSGGLLGILEWRFEETDEGPPVDHRLEPETIDAWLREAGFRKPEREPWSDGQDLYLAHVTETEE